MRNAIHNSEHMVLVELVREMRLKANLTQARVSEELGVAQSRVSDIERGTRKLDVIELKELAKICGRTLSEVVVEFEARLKKKRAPGKR